MLCSMVAALDLGLGLFAFSFCCWVGMDASFLCLYFAGEMLGGLFGTGNPSFSFCRLGQR